MNYTNNLLNIAGGGGDALQLNNVEVLYTKVQKVYVKGCGKEERQRELRVNVEIHSGLSPVCRKSLCVLLSDDEDPCFLYSLIIADEDFKVLKAQQGLLVDFDNFATQLINLLEQCQAQVSTPKFLLLLTEENADWTLKLVETNNFKHLCHLSLNISRSGDAEVKTHMAMKIKHLKDTLLHKNRDAVGMEARLNELTIKLDHKTREVEQLEQRFHAEKSELQMSLSQKVCVEKDRLAQARLEWQRQVEREKLELEQRHAEVLKKLHTELAELRTQNMTYRDKLSFLEATNKEQAKHLQSLEKELNIEQRDLAQLKKQNSKLDSEYHEKDKTVNSLRTKVAVLEQEMKDKSVLIAKHTEMLKTAKEQKQQLEDLLADKESQLQRKQSSLKNLSEELVKANEILTKLQNELASTKSKLKLRTSIALEQERLLDSKQKELGQLESKMETQTKDLNEAKSQIDSLSEQVKHLQIQLEEKEKAIKNNDNVIGWLNRRLADNQSPSHNNASVPITVPSTVQLTLPRTNKVFGNRYETKTPGQGITQSNGPLSTLPLRNPIVQNPNINQTAPHRSGRTLGVGVADNSVGPSNFTKAQMIGTSTPLDRVNGAINNNKVSPTNSVPAIVENNNSVPLNSNAKSKTATNALHSGLRRAVLDKPLLPSAYFPKSLH